VSRLGVASSCSNPIDVIPQSTLPMSLLFHECCMSRSFDCPKVGWRMLFMESLTAQFFDPSVTSNSKDFLGTQISNTFSLDVRYQFSYKYTTKDKISLVYFNITPSKQTRILTHHKLQFTTLFPIC
jgi:hypothetical protein